MGGDRPRPLVITQKPERKAEAVPRLDPVPAPAGPRDEGGLDNFQKILAALQKEKSSLAAILSRQASFRIKDEPLDIKFSTEKRFVIDHPLILEISFSGGDEYYREAVHRDIRTLERIASEVFGQKIKVKLGETAVPRETRREKENDLALKDPTVRAFMDTFKATILSVEPVKGTKERE
jgi:hypothetical protein